MPYDFGPLFIKFAEGVLERMLSKAESGKKGPSIQKKAGEKYGGFLDDELLGKVGPIIGVYEPEATNRITGDWE